MRIFVGLIVAIATIIAIYILSYLTNLFHYSGTSFAFGWITCWIVSFILGKD